MARRGRSAVDNTIELLDLWNRALAEPTGIKIRSEKPRRLSNMLYKVRRESGHFNYDHYRVTHDDTHVWIVPR